MNNNVVQVVVLILSGFGTGVIIGSALVRGQLITSDHTRPKRSHNPSKEQGSEMVEIPRKSLDVLENFLAGIAFLSIGWAFSIIVEGCLDYWRTVSLGEALLFGAVLITITMILQRYE